MIHIGKAIEERVYKSGMTIVEFATRINKSRNVVYNIFTRETIDTGLLYKISEVLEYNFFKLYFEGDKMKNDTSVLAELNNSRKQLDKLMKDITQLKKAVKKK